MSEKFITENGTILLRNKEDFVDFKLCINERCYNTRFLQNKETSVFYFEGIERENDDERYKEITFDKKNTNLSSDEIKFLREAFVVQTYPFKFDKVKTQYEEAFSDRRVTINQLQTYLYKIKGRPLLKKTEDELISDLKKIKTIDKTAFIVINKGIPTVTLIQTS